MSKSFYKPLIKRVDNDSENSEIELADGTIIRLEFGYSPKGVWSIFGFRVQTTIDRWLDDAELQGAE